MPQDDPNAGDDLLFGTVVKSETSSTVKRFGIIAVATIFSVLGVFAVSWFWPESTPYDDKVRKLEQGMTEDEVEEELGLPHYIFTSDMRADGIRLWTDRGILLFSDPGLGEDVLVYWNGGTESALLIGLKGEWGYPRKIDKWCVQKSKNYKAAMDLKDDQIELDLSDFRPSLRHALNTKCHSMD